MAHIVVIDEGTKQQRYKVMYEVRTINGIRKRKSKTFPENTNMKEIKAFVRTVEKQYEDDDVGLNYDRLSFRQFFKIYEDSYLKHLSPTTSSNYMQMAYNKKNGFLEFLGDIQLSKLNAIHLQRYVDFLVDSGLSAKTVKNRIMCIHGVIDKAMQLHYINKSYNFVGDVIAPKIVKKQIQSYNEDEVKKLLELVDKDACDNVKLLIYLAVTTGMRRSEMNALTFDDIDLKEKTINVNKARVYQHRGKCVVKETKTASSVRVIPITNTLCTLIKKARNDYYKKMFAKGEDFVDSKAMFTDDCGNPLRSETLSNEYKDFMDSHADEIRYLTITNLSSKTKTNYIMLLRVILNMARKLEYITFVINPVEDIVIVRTRPNERTPYTIEEARIILDEASRCDDNNTKMIIFLGLTCGLRRSEMAGVQIKDIDYEDCSISISHARVAAGHMGDFEKAPKSYNGYRKIYVTEELMELLKQERNRKNDSDYLLTDEYNNLLRVYKISELYRKFMQKLDIEYKSLHSLRHTYASILASKGVNAKNIQYTLGHSSYTTSMNIYVGVYEDDCRRMTESLQKTLF